MHKSLTYIMTALFAMTLVAFADADDDALIANEKAAWQAYKDKKADDFKKLVGPILLSVYADGVADMEKELADMQKWDIKSVSFSDFKVTRNGGNTAAVTYKVALQATAGGKDISGTYNAGSVWLQVYGQWRGFFHTAIKQEVAK